MKKNLVVPTSFLGLLLGSTAHAATQTTVTTTGSGVPLASGNNVMIDIYGTNDCRKVTNSTGKNIFVPTKNINEWYAFLDNSPANVGLALCTTPAPSPGPQCSYSCGSPNGGRTCSAPCPSGSSSGGGSPNSSDMRLKANIAPMTGEDGLQSVMKLRPVRFVWNDSAETAKGDQFGFIAQDVEKVYPDLVGRQPDREVTHSDGKTENLTDLRTLNYNALIAPVVEAVQELNKLVNELKAHNAEQDEQIKQLQKENTELKTRLDAIETKQGGAAKK